MKQTLQLVTELTSYAAVMTQANNCAGGLFSSAFVVITMDESFHCLDKFSDQSKQKQTIHMEELQHVLGPTGIHLVSASDSSTKEVEERVYPQACQPDDMQDCIPPLGCKRELVHCNLAAHFPHLIDVLGHFALEICKELVAVLQTSSQWPSFRRVAARELGYKPFQQLCDRGGWLQTILERFLGWMRKAPEHASEVAQQTTLLQARWFFFLAMRNWLNVTTCPC